MLGYSKEELFKIDFLHLLTKDSQQIIEIHSDQARQQETFNHCLELKIKALRTLQWSIAESCFYEVYHINKIFYISEPSCS